MIAEAIQKIADMTRQSEEQELTTLITLPFAGANREYEFATELRDNGRQLGSVVQPLRPQPLRVSTLTGFVDAIRAGVGSDSAPAPLVHVEDYLTVSLKARNSDPWGGRDVYVVAKHEPVQAFTFDHYYADPARFIIGLQVAFLATEELLWLIRVASSLKAGNSVQTSDDGFSQTVTLKAGEVSTAEVQIKPRIRLVPIRSFSEINPADSEFLIRFQQTPQGSPSIALFNVDGTKWKDETMLSIRKHLEAQLPDATILA